MIGLTGEDLQIDARIALRCARMALSVAAAGRQQTMAVSVLAQPPHAAQWARSFTRDIPIFAKAFRRHAAPATVHAALRGTALACIPQPDQMLRDLLIGAIGECAPSASRDAGRRRALARCPSERVRGRSKDRTVVIG